MLSKKVLIALSLPFMFSLTACGSNTSSDSGGGDADQYVVRNIFAVGDILETKEDTPGVTGNVCDNDQPDACGLLDRLDFSVDIDPVFLSPNEIDILTSNVVKTPDLFVGDMTFGFESKYGLWPDAKEVVLAKIVFDVVEQASGATTIDILNASDSGSHKFKGQPQEVVFQTNHVVQALPIVTPVQNSTTNYVYVSDGYFSQDKSQLIVTLSYIPPKKLLFALEAKEAMENGSFSFCADGTYRYAPSDFFTGSESIDYTYTGDGVYGVETLEINVYEAGQVITGSVGDNSNAAVELTYSLSAGEATENGTLVFCHNGEVEYTPVQNFHGVDSVKYIASLDGDNSTATLTVEVSNDFETLDEYGWNLEWCHDFTVKADICPNIVEAQAYGIESIPELWGGNYNLIDEGLIISPNQGQDYSLVGDDEDIIVERGRIEAKVKTANGVDVMSAFKLVPVSDSYDGDNSLSLMLSKDETMTAGAYYGLEKVSGVIMNDDVRSTASDDWHTYAIEWGEKQIRWYIDGTHVYTVDTLNVWAYNQTGDNPRGDEIIANTTSLFDQRTPNSVDQRGPGPFDQAMQIVFDLEAASENLTADMQVEYVKFWSCDATVEPRIEECASKEKPKISRAASDRVETVGFEQTTIFKDGYRDPATDALLSQFHPLNWHYWEEVFDLTITNNGNSKVKYLTLEDEHGLVVDFDNSSGLATLGVATESAELNGYDISLNFDLFVNSADTDVETVNIRMQSGNSEDDSADDLAIIELSIPFDGLELNAWNSLKFNIPDDFTPSAENSSDFDPSNITSLMVLEVVGGAHLQLDNIYIGCVNSEGCLQGPMAMQTPPAPKADPIRIEAEEEILSQGIGTYDVTAPEEGGGSYVGDVNNGDFVSYSFTAPGIGPYTIDYRVASQGESDGFVMSLDGVPVHSVSIPDTGGWEEWQTISTQPFELIAGVYTIQLDFVDDGQNLNWLQIQPPISIFTIEAEDYDVMKGIELETTTDDGGGQNIGYIDKGDYVEYTVFVPSTGDFLIEYRVAGLWDSQGFEVRFDDILVDSQALETPSGWQSWDTQSNVISLTEGEKTMRFDFIDGPININWIRFTRLAPE
jgi:hypothetical protein